LRTRFGRRRYADEIAALRRGRRTGWLSVLGERTDGLPVPALDQPALLSWTSGTTGSPKAFLLTHRNIATNIEALRELAVVGPQDRALLPLPLHHAYPFIVGMLVPLPSSGPWHKNDLIGNPPLPMFVEVVGPPEVSRR
jgi:acyl-CoA synthetase (AMP-forming)/AMP-acid ligase II